MDQLIAVVQTGFSAKTGVFGIWSADENPEKSEAVSPTVCIGNERLYGPVSLFVSVATVARTKLLSLLCLVLFLFSFLRSVRGVRCTDICTVLGVLRHFYEHSLQRSMSWCSVFFSQEDVFP